MTGAGGRALLGLVVVALGMLAWFVWPTPYRYLPGDREMGFHAIRVHRVTGDVQVLVIRQQTAGWISR